MKISRLVLAGLAIVLLLPLLPAVSHAENRLDLGSQAPTLSGPDVLGNIQRLDDYRGRWVYIDFWASWCKPCMEELPNVVALNSQLGKRGDFAVLSVSLDDQNTAENLLLAAGKYQLNYPVVYDGQGWHSQIVEDWGLSTIPATFLVDPQGRIAARDIHPMEVSSIVQLMQYPTFKPIQLQSQETLLSTSPSSGRQDMRDLNITIDVAKNSPSISRYQLFVASSCPSADGQTLRYNVRYDLNFIEGDEGARIPFRVDIQKLSGETYLAPSERHAGDLPLNMDIPEMSVAVDMAAGHYDFIVPLPACSQEVGYALALYDERLGQYVRNGMQRVDASSGY